MPAAMEKDYTIYKNYNNNAGIFNFWCKHGFIGEIKYNIIHDLALFYIIAYKEISPITLNF